MQEKSGRLSSCEQLTSVPRQPHRIQARGRAVALRRASDKRFLAKRASARAPARAGCLLPKLCTIASPKRQRLCRTPKISHSTAVAPLSVLTTLVVCVM
jgi:hypothetical protein